MAPGRRARAGAPDDIKERRRSDHPSRDKRRPCQQGDGAGAGAGDDEKHTQALNGLNIDHGWNVLKLM